MFLITHSNSKTAPPLQLTNENSIRMAETFWDLELDNIKAIWQPQVREAVIFRAVNSILQLTHTSIGFILNKGKSNEDDSEIVRVTATATDGPVPIFEIVRVFLYI